MFAFMAIFFIITQPAICRAITQFRLSTVEFAVIARDRSIFLTDPDVTFRYYMKTVGAIT